MNFLHYKSDEMYSSTQLIRQSKMIFDKLSKDEIEKAVILRDGKPSFLLLDFATYEKIMEEYLQLKEQNGMKLASVEQTQVKEVVVNKETSTELPEQEPQSSVEEEIEMDLNIEKALQEDELITEQTPTKSKLTQREQAELDKALLELERVDKDAADKKREELKEFWD